MNTTMTAAEARREFLKISAGVGGASLLGAEALAQGNALNYNTWSAAVDLVRGHTNAFSQKTGIKVNYANSPWAQYRDTMVTRFVGKAPMDVLWVSDSWLPEWADAGWIAPINDYPQLLAYNKEADKFCTDSMIYKGKQYGLTYYSDYMAFFYDEQMLAKAGIKEPPKTWDELVQQSLKIKSAALDGTRKLADRVPECNGFLERRQLYRSPGRIRHGRSAKGRAEGAAMGDRRRPEAQDHFARVR
jgi:multiple sugar transport system substrate-binding protein